MTRLGWPLRTLRSQVQLLVGGLLVLLLVSAAGTLLVQRQVTSTQDRLRMTLRPAQVAVAMLGEAYVNEETGARGYQLTGDSVFLQPYNAGHSQAANLRRRLGSELARDKPSQRLLADVDQAAANWLNQPAMREIAQRHQPSPPGQVPLSQALTEKHLFDRLRMALGSLVTRINQLAAEELADINGAQAVANGLTIAAGVLALALVFVAALMLRISLSRPLTRLVTEVQQVVDGELGHSVDVRGPEELSTVARAVERMRVRILAQTARAMEMQRRLDMADESERIADGLQDVVIRRLSGTGLLLHSTASRYPLVARALSGAVDEIDRAIRELRAVIFGLKAGRGTGGLHKRVLNLLSEAEPRLGFTPHLQFERIPPAGIAGKVADELIITLREILSNTARHPHASDAEIKISVTGGILRLQVTDNRQASAARPEEAGTSVLGNLSARAELLGGTCTVGHRPGGGTAIDWAVPVNTSGPAG